LARRRYGKPHSAAADTRPAEPASAEPSPASAPAPDQAEAEPEPAQQQFSLKAQIEQQRAYAEQQQQQAQLAQLHAYINAIPNLSPAQRQWLAANPHGLYRFDLLHAAHQMALQHGIAPDSGDYFRVLESALHHYGHLPPQQPAQAAPAPAAPAPQPMTHVDLEKVESADHEPEEMHMRAEHVSAPVSRSDHGYAIEPEPTEGSIRLTAEQRDIAHRSGISDTEYAKQLLRMQRMRKSGLLKD
jgi:hypothetical protein